MVWFLGTIVALMPGTALVSFRTLVFFFPLVTGTFSSFNVTHSLSILDHCSCFIQFSRAWRQNFAIEVSDLYSSSPLSSTFDSNRYLLMNLHVVQFQNGFELLGLTYSQFVQTFQDFIGWDLGHRQHNFVPSCFELLNIIIMKG